MDRLLDLFSVVLYGVLYSLPPTRRAAVTKNARMLDVKRYFRSLSLILPSYLLEEGLSSHLSEKAKTQQEGYKQSKRE